MVSTKSIVLGCALALSTAGLALPAPAPEADAPNCVDDNCVYDISAGDLTNMDSSMASCNTTDEFANECTDASGAAPAITKSFEKYGISEPGVQAALIAIMLYESDSFKYNKNHYPVPGRPGQGTRNMQMFPFNEKYATDLFGAGAVANAKATRKEAAVEDRVLALVQGDEESFASAAWFLTTQCTEDIKTGLASGTSEGWDTYLTECVGTTHTEDRDASWTAAKKVLGA